ncbi:MAG: beta-lactamase family protein [Hyphomonadaceae bacterium]|nr:beta-lactamase family protein [Hyphomonadaceae bacterium]
MDRRAFLLSAAACSIVSASTTQLAIAQTPARFGTAANYSSQRDGATFLVARHGVLLAEQYTAGNADTRWPIGMGTRTFLSLLAASLVEDRLMTLDEPVALTLGDWGADPVKSLISIRTLLSGASGLRFERNGPQDVATAIALQPRETPGTSFSDDAATYVIFAEIARRKLETGGREPDPARYLTSRTLLPIGCVPIGWARTRDGAVRLDDGAAVSARGWAQAGELIRREGVWRAQQLADDGALREAMRGSFAEMRAGFGLWLASGERGRDNFSIDTDLWRAPGTNAPADLVMAAGQGGQRLYLAPSDGLVIVRQARTLTSNSWSDAQFLSLIWRDL